MSFAKFASSPGLLFLWSALSLLFFISVNGAGTSTGENFLPKQLLKDVAGNHLPDKWTYQAAPGHNLLGKKIVRNEGNVSGISRCQAPKAVGDDVMSHCPRGTVFVSQTSPAAHFRTINAALQSLADSDTSVRTILIDTGNYNEKVVIKRKTPLILVGVTGEPDNTSENRVTIWQSTYVNQKDPSDKKANCDAVTLGVGLSDGHTGNVNFKAYNINFVQRQIQNGRDVTQSQLGPAAALCVQNSRASFYGCGFSSYQDTIYVGAGSQALFHRSIVKGMTDQLYGEGRAWFEKCLLLSRACGGGIAAWKGSGNPNDRRSGVYISNSRIAVSPDAQTLKPMTGKCHLGRPWNSFAQTVYLNNYMTDIIAPEGFRTWNNQQTNFDPKTTHFLEYNSSGPGAHPSQRDKSVQRLLTREQAAMYTYERVFDFSADWIDTHALTASLKRANKTRHHPHVAHVPKAAGEL